MAQRYDAARGQEIIDRWCVVAEQRLDHLTELFESGRWRRYHSETAFMENIREAKAAVETWQALARREATLDNAPVNLSWLGRATPVPPRRPSLMRNEAIEPPRLASSLAGTTLPTAPDDSRTHEAAPLDAELAAPEPVPETALDIGAIRKRYPSLHNAL